MILQVARVEEGWVLNNTETLRAARAFAQNLSKQNRTFQQIEAALDAQGFDAETTRITLRNLLNDSLDTRERQGWRGVYYGLGLAAIGAVVTAVTLAASAAQGSGLVIVAWGALLIGVLWAAQGWWLLRSAERYRAQRLYDDPPAASEAKGQP
jgi:hypothetical protein